MWSNLGYEVLFRKLKEGGRMKASQNRMLGRLVEPNRKEAGRS
jgi:hypothetical protein